MMGSVEFKVGLFVLVCLGVIAAMSFQVNNDPTIAGKSHHYEVLIPNASGLVKDASVKMAGIPVGVIRDIRLQDGKARVILFVKGDVKVTKNASAELKPNGILGDKYIELNPGNPDVEALPDGGRILNFEDKGSLDTVMNQVGVIAKNVADITENMKKATSAEGDENSPIGRTIKNLEVLSGDLRELADNKKEKLEAIVDNLHSITRSMNEFINDDSDEGFKTNWKKMAMSLGKVDKILGNVEEITAKVNDGKGTLGKLINDDTTVEELNHAISGVNNMMDTAGKFQVSVDYHSEHLGGGDFIKTYVGIVIQPGPDRYYLIQAVDDPKGSYDATSALSTTPGQPTTSNLTQYVYHNRLKLNAEFAKNFYNLTLRAGIIESTGGLAADYYLFNRSLRISAEAFAFSRPEGVDIRVYAKYKFFNIFYAMIGGDDIANPGNNFDGTAAAGFIGAGLEFSNDDLKLLLTKVPF